MNTKSIKSLPILMLLAGSLIVGFSTGRWLAPLVAWIGPVLIMRYYRDQKVGRGYIFVVVAYTLAWLIAFGQNWKAQLPALVFILPPFYALLWSLPYLADRLVGVRLKGFASTLVYPLAAATMELVNIHTNPVGMWGATGFTQYGNLPIMQLASVTGMIGITFLMGWFASVANWAWENRAQGGPLFPGLAIFGVVFAAVYGFGFLRLNTVPGGETIRVAGITARQQSDMSGDSSGDAVQSYWNAYFTETVREAQAGAQVIVWPEGGGIAYNHEESTSLVAQAQEVARQNEIYLAFGYGMLYSEEGKPWQNKLLVIDPTGAIVMEHIKYGGNIIEGTLLGDKKLRTVDTPFGVLSGVVCWDMDFPAIIQQAGRNGTGLMLVPSKDSIEIDPLHSQMAVFRGIENGMSVVRQVESGLSIATDPYGRVLAQTDFFGATDRTLVAQIPVKHVTTIYSLFGSYLEWLAPLGLLPLILRALTVRRQTN